MVSRYRSQHVRAAILFYMCMYVYVCVRTRVNAKRISMPQTIGQLLVLRRRASENHKLGRSEVTGYGGMVQGLYGFVEAGRGMSPIRMRDASAFKVVARLPDIPLRNHVMRDFYCFLPPLSIRINDVSIFSLDNIGFLAFHWDPGFFLADRGFRFLFVTNIPLMQIYEGS